MHFTTVLHNKRLHKLVMQFFDNEIASTERESPYLVSRRLT